MLNKRPKSCWALFTCYLCKVEPLMDDQTFGLTWKRHPSAFLLQNDDTFGTRFFFWENIPPASISEVINRVLQSPQLSLVSLNVLSIRGLAFKIKIMAYSSMQHSLSGEGKCLARQRIDRLELQNSREETSLASKYSSP